jgi:hypothetical protein
MLEEVLFGAVVVEVPFGVPIPDLLLEEVPYLVEVAAELAEKLM